MHNNFSIYYTVTETSNFFETTRIIHKDPYISNIYASNNIFNNNQVIGTALTRATCQQVGDNIFNIIISLIYFIKDKGNIVTEYSYISHIPSSIFPPNFEAKFQIINGTEAFLNKKGVAYLKVIVDNVRQVDFYFE